jgi:hypothetical protein
MTLVAVTRIKHGMPDGNVLTIEPGDPIKDLSPDEITTLKESGAVADIKIFTEANVEPLQQEIQRLKEELAFANRRLEEKEGDKEELSKLRQPYRMTPETGASVLNEESTITPAPTPTPAVKATPTKKE